MRPGQAVGQDVTDSQRNILVRAGTPLTEELIQRFVQRGVLMVTVTGSEAIGTAPELVGPPTEELDRLFEGNLENALMSSLLDAVKRFHVEKAG